MVEDRPEQTVKSYFIYILYRTSSFHYNVLAYLFRITCYLYTTTTKQQNCNCKSSQWYCVNVEELLQQASAQRHGKVDGVGDKEGDGDDSNDKP